MTSLKKAFDDGSVGRRQLLQKTRAMLVMTATCIFFLIASMLKADGTDFEKVEDEGKDN